MSALVSADPRVDVAVAEDAFHLMWRGEPQHKPVRWTCSGCLGVETSAEDRTRHRVSAVVEALDVYDAEHEDAYDRAIRERIAAEIESMETDEHEHWSIKAIRAAARIARGES